MVSLRPDWAALTVRPGCSRDGEVGVAHAILQAVHPGPCSLGSAKYYERTVRSDDGLVFVDYWGRGDAVGTLSVGMTGKYWASLADPVGSLPALLHPLGLPSRVTRFDLAGDYSGPAVPSVRDLWAATSARAVRMRFREWDFRAGPRGESLYLGSSHSEWFIRVYDERGPLRIELMRRQEYARKLLGLIELVGVGDAYGATLTGAVGFPSVPGWTALLGVTGSVSSV
jgi:hypothetical protein